MYNSNPKLRYQTSHGAGMKRNPSIGLITGIPSNVFTKYTAGSGVGASSIFARRSKLQHAVICDKNCGYLFYLDQPNYNVNGRYFFSKK